MNSLSILREAQYKALGKISLSGRVIDIGGDKKGNYHQLFTGEFVVTTANIDPSFSCDLVFDAEQRFPLPDGAFDAALAINVLEHVFDTTNVVSEMVRVLTPGGRIVIAVPFMHPVHGSPHDYHRFTSEALKELLMRTGCDHITITSTGEGFFSATHQMIVAPLPVVIRVPLKYLARALDGFLSWLSPAYARFAKNIPLGYIVIAEVKQ